MWNWNTALACAIALTMFSISHSVYALSVTPEQAEQIAHQQQKQSLEQQQLALSFDDQLKLAKSGDVSAMIQVGRYYYTPPQHDLKQAEKWLSKAAKKGNPAGQTALGRFYEKQKDYKQAIKWYEKAAKQRDGEALYLLGALYSIGYGVQADSKKSIDYIIKSADAGYGFAQMVLADRYRTGVSGVALDIDKAIALYEQAKNNGYEIEAEKKIQEIKEQQSQQQPEQ